MLVAQQCVQGQKADLTVQEWLGPSSVWQELAKAQTVQKEGW